MAVGSSAAVAKATARWGLAAHVYVSEGRDRAFVSRLSAIGRAAGVAVANEFLDTPYNRAGITLASNDTGRLEAAIGAVCHEALLALDLRSHSATHPRVGVVDHVACNPLGVATCEEAGRLAVRVGSRLGRGEAGVRPGVPVYFYGAAREDGRPLAELRRSLGYFHGAAHGTWTGLSSEMADAMKALAPDTGPQAVDPRYGAAVVGAVPWVANYNILVSGQGIDETELMSKCRRIARLTSARGGGLPAVETMALPHEKGVEVACNLLDLQRTPATEVHARVAELAEVEGLQLTGAYFTNKQPEEVLDLATASSEDLVDALTGTPSADNVKRPRRN